MNAGRSAVEGRSSHLYETTPQRRQKERAYVDALKKATENSVGSDPDICGVFGPPTSDKIVENFSDAESGISIKKARITEYFYNDLHLNKHLHDVRYLIIEDLDHPDKIFIQHIQPFCNPNVLARYGDATARKFDALRFVLTLGLLNKISNVFQRVLSGKRFTKIKEVAGRDIRTGLPVWKKQLSISHSETGNQKLSHQSKPDDTKVIFGYETFESDPHSDGCYMSLIKFENNYKQSVMPLRGRYGFTKCEHKGLRIYQNGMKVLLDKENGRNYVLTRDFHSGEYCQHHVCGLFFHPNKRAPLPIVSDESDEYHYTSLYILKMEAYSASTLIPFDFWDAGTPDPNLWVHIDSLFFHTEELW